MGFAPADNPKIVVAVLLEYGQHGYFAARIASKIIEAYLKAPAHAPPVTDDVAGQRIIAEAPAGSGTATDAEPTAPTP